MPRTDMTVLEQFEELVAKYGDPFTGVEDFQLHDSDIHCMCGDSIMTIKSDGWHYGGEVAGYPTALECFENCGGQPKKKRHKGLTVIQVDIKKIHKCSRCCEYFLLISLDKDDVEEERLPDDLYRASGFNYCPFCGM